MAKYFQADAGGAVEIGFEGERFLLFVPDTQHPLDRHWAGQQSDGHPGVLKPVGGESQVRLHAGGSNPSGVGQLTAMGAGRFHPVQGLRPTPTVVAGEAEEPQADHGNRGCGINEEKAAHKCL